MELNIGSVILAHPNPDTTIPDCHLMQVRKVWDDKVAATLIDREGNIIDGLMLIPMKDIRVCGKEIMVDTKLDWKQILINIIERAKK